MSFPSFFLFALLLAFKREAQCRHFAATSAAGAGSSGCSSNRGDCVEIAKFSIGRARGCA
jgi:hypothetical protein